MLSQCRETIYDSNDEETIVENMGGYLIRGDTITLVGEIEREKQKQPEGADETQALREDENVVAKEIESFYTDVKISDQKDLPRQIKI